MDENNKKTRRTFLDRGLKLGVAGVLGGIGLSKLSAKFSEEKSPTGETMELMTTDGTIVEVDTSEVMEVEHHHHYSMDYNVREGIPNRKFVMVVDLAKCKNALKCQQSCNKNHYITGENAWLKVYKMQESADTAPYWLPMMCQHCDKPACVTVCPVDATFKREDGLVLIDNERCIGCRFCMAACPYSTRVFNWEEPAPGETAEIHLHMEHEAYSPDYAGVQSKMGTVDKCDFCPHMIDRKELPHCVTACPNGVFFFGDAYEDTVTNGDETFRLGALLEKRAGYRMLEHLGTEPSVYYLPPSNRLVDFQEGLENYTPNQSVNFESEE